MVTAEISVDIGSPEPEKLETIAGVLKNQGVVVYPTDTFYGLGADCFSEDAVSKVFHLKGRDWNKPLSLVIADMEMLQEVVSRIPPVFEAVAGRFWPGPLTIVFEASWSLPENLHAGSGSIAVRLPDHPWLRQLIRHAGFPITATSANISGGREVQHPSQAGDIFSGRVDMLVDGGPTRGGLPSTVLDIRGHPRLLREGAVPAEKLKDFLPSP